MDHTIKTIKRLQSTLTTELDIVSMKKRNPTAHKWIECFRVWSLRELVSWRFLDLSYQAALLQKDKHALGAGILLRSSIETLGMLIYSNIQIEKLLNSDHNFQDLSGKTVKLLFGSKNGLTDYIALNIMGVIKQCDKARTYNLKEKYDNLSECAHPNWNGMMLLYSRIDRDNDIQYFENRAPQCFQSNAALLDLLLKLFLHEYAKIWPENFEKFEIWVENNDEKLTKNFGDSL